MTKISDMKEPRKNNGYSELLFGEAKRGALVSQVQAASISFGSGLQNFISSLIPDEDITTVDKVSNGGINKKMVALEPQKPSSGDKKGVRPDFAIFDPAKKICHVVELKSGYTFDTQKAETAKRKLQEASDYFANRTGYTCKIYVCSYLAETNEAVMQGFKKNFESHQVMSFDELCLFLGISRNAIEFYIKTHQAENRAYWDIMTGAILEGDSDLEYFGKMEANRTGQPRLFYE